MEQKNILLEIKENLEEVVQRRSSRAKSLWKELIQQHPVDIADFLGSIDKEHLKKIFVKFPKDLKFEVFQELSDTLKAFCLSFMAENEQVDVLHSLSVDDLTDLFDYFSDEELKKYLNLLHKRSREKVLSLLKFHPDSAGGIMDIEVLSLIESFTVEKSIKILQRLRPDQEIYRHIYVTDKSNKLVGHINLEDLVVHRPKERLSDIIRKNELVVQADEDQESIAQRMVHYNLTTVPVVGTENEFLGVIPAETLMDVLVEEASEDVQKMAALAPMRRTYLETPFHKILLGRSGILMVLLFAQSLSVYILEEYMYLLPLILVPFITMLISTGGNASHQTSALILQGIASGELHPSNLSRFLRREFLIGFSMALILGGTAFFRVYLRTGSLLSSFAIGLILGLIVLMAVTLGSGAPLILKRIGIDPAFSAGPFLATFMDILGVLIFCIILSTLVSRGLLSI